MFQSLVHDWLRRALESQTYRQSNFTPVAVGEITGDALLVCEPPSADLYTEIRASGVPAASAIITPVGFALDLLLMPPGAQGTAQRDITDSLDLRMLH